MCGIFAVLGNDPATLRKLIDGLRRLEYRGYDSAGACVAVQEEGAKQATLSIVKKKGAVQNLADASTELQKKAATVGIAHTRWATHGAPNDINAHPHASTEGRVVVVHNGIVENYRTLRETLIQRGHKVKSETDTELLAHLVQDCLDDGCTPDEAVSTALNRVEGTFGCVFMFEDYPDLLIGARRGSPLILGIRNGHKKVTSEKKTDPSSEDSKSPQSDAEAKDEGPEYYLASDASAIVEHTKEVVYLREDEMVVVTRQGYQVTSLKSTGHVRNASIHELDLDLMEIEKGGYKHYMLKEIMEQPSVLENSMRGRVMYDPNEGKGRVRLGGLKELMPKLLKARRLIIVACGTSLHAAMVGEYMIESLARIPVEVEYASEFRYRDPIIFEDDVVIAISQSGETADTLAAIRHAKECGATTVGLVNVVGSSIARETDGGVYLHVGTEIGVASTKAFTGQVIVVAMMAVLLAQESGKLSQEEVTKHVLALMKLPQQVEAVLSQKDQVLDISRSFRFSSSFLYLGRGYNFPVALEGALKLKEISYIHAEGYAAAEMKHGPIALIDKFMPVVFIAPSYDSKYSKIKSNIEEVRAREGLVICITDEQNKDFDDTAEAVLRIPTTIDPFVPILSVVPLQLMSYYIADLRKCEVDKPRNLAKSVVVE